jgi:hypothetical protein
MSERVPVDPRAILGDERGLKWPRENDGQVGHFDRKSGRHPNRTDRIGSLGYGLRDGAQVGAIDNLIKFTPPLKLGYGIPEFQPAEAPSYFPIPQGAKVFFYI